MYSYFHYFKNLQPCFAWHTFLQLTCQKYLTINTYHICTHLYYQKVLSINICQSNALHRVIDWDVVADTFAVEIPRIMVVENMDENMKVQK